ncbi:MAG: carboxypeptidase-like regulatory domain-containing protein, partial [Gemmatimonadetes bacterium]|nr:carboxypeptidase-like regulatory domain-containing protein [Gemmatimonadota bacterium]
MRVIRVLIGFALLLGVTSWSSAEAQQATGSLTGVVTDGASGRPLSAAQVFIEGTGLGGLTNASGRYLIVNVPAGQHRLRVERIGYTAGVQQVTVTAGQATARDFALQE